jgi:hypothetical protein
MITLFSQRSQGTQKRIYRKGKIVAFLIIKKKENIYSVESEGRDFYLQ